ncbi:retrovirus-related Pol polyprotein from transposon 297 [Trichonephila clavipes]|nr:retrovirus-related Pol polyprotein from transposon 297 [Trichonephila clavipes]
MKNGETVADYIARARGISTKCHSLGLDVSLRELVYHTVRGLNGKFSKVRDILKTQRGKSMDEILQILREEEATLNLPIKTRMDGINSEAFYFRRTCIRLRSCESIASKRFKLSPENFVSFFVKHQKNPETSWDDFYYELQTYFEGWIAGLGITTFEQLKDLMITDQLKKKAPIEFKVHHLDEWSRIISPVDLARKIEEYEDVRKTFQKKVTWSYSKDTMKRSGITQRLFRGKMYQ